MTIHERARTIFIMLQIEGCFLGLTKKQEEYFIDIIEFQLKCSHEYHDGKK